MNDLKARTKEEAEEGLKLVVYLCTKGHHTIGWGHNVDSHPLTGDILAYFHAHNCITDEMADRLLDQDIADAVKDCRKLFPAFNTLSENRQDALIDMMFNMGFSTFAEFHGTIAHINRGEWDQAVQHIELTDYRKELPARAQRNEKLLREG